MVHATKNRKILATLGAIMLAVPGTLDVGGTAAQGADSNDPYASGCVKDGYPVAAAYITSGSPNKAGGTAFGNLHLMYSPSCGKNWAEFDNYPNSTNFELVVWNQNIASEQEDWISTGDAVAWTDMVPGKNLDAGVGICKYSYSGSVTGRAYLIQGNTKFVCMNGFTSAIEY